MSPRSFLLSEPLAAYVAAHTTDVGEVERRLVEATAALGSVAGMQISPDQGALLRILTSALGVTEAIEVGTFTGYSALSIARGLAPGGRLLCCDVSEEWTAIARTHWHDAGVADRIELRISDALATIEALPAEPRFQLAFIDADKPSYQAYLDALAPRLVPGAVVLVDNVLWSGRVIDLAADDESTTALRAFNDALAADDRFESTILTVGDGLTLARRR